MHAGCCPPNGPGSAADDGDADDGSGGEGVQETAGVKFRMLLKRGGKEDRSRELQLPADTAMAAAVMARREAEAAEREQMKLLTLAANKQLQQEDAEAANASKRFHVAGGRGGGGRGGGRQTYGEGGRRGRGYGGGEGRGGGSRHKEYRGSIPTSLF
eukprot:1140157-Pelagomonas_calceolata.AAC.1